MIYAYISSWYDKMVSTLDDLKMWRALELIQMHIMWKGFRDTLTSGKLIGVYISDDKMTILKKRNSSDRV